MGSGWSAQLAKQAGEYFVAAELCRRGYLSATFSGGVRDYDIVGIDQNGRTVLVQVKTILGGAWQIGDAGKLINIDGPDEQGVQVVSGVVTLGVNPVWVFVYMEHPNAPLYYIARTSQVQGLVLAGYKANLDKHGGKRPRNSASRHHALSVADLSAFQDCWHVIDEAAANMTSDRPPV